MNKDELFKIQSNTLNVAIGNVLIAEPFFSDPHFMRSVILMVDHDKEGSFGVIFNKRIPASINDLIMDFPEFKADVYLGGPVETNRIFFIHTVGELIPESSKICGNIYWSYNLNALKALIKNNLVQSHEVRFFVGYSGWDAGQLRTELKANAWLVGKFSSKDLLTTNPKTMWKSFVDKMGERYSLWSKFPTNPSFN
ncbi:MAG: YqgE/AlgH family protein [Bacteroidales bacterium]|nr:YqgE/AlgH family protein [Bacteroidales bacterium]